MNVINFVFDIFMVRRGTVLFGRFHLSYMYFGTQLAHIPSFSNDLQEIMFVLNSLRESELVLPNAVCASIWLCLCICMCVVCMFYLFMFSLLYCFLSSFICML